MPKVTLGITSYNAADTLPTAVQSAFAQTHDNCEVIVVDDASTDTTPDVLAKLQQQYPALRVVINSVNKGVAANRNRLIAESTGDYLAFFDDDDTSDPQRVEKQLAALQQCAADTGSTLAVCHTARWQAFPDGSRNYCATQHGTPTPRGLPVALRILLGKPISRTKHGAMATCSQMARIDTYKAVGGFDDELRRSEDTDFNIRLALAGGYFVGLPDALVTQQMTLGAEKRWQDEHAFALRLLEKHKTVVTAAGFDGFAAAWLTMKLAFLEGEYANFARQAAGVAMRYPWQSIQRLCWVLPNALENLKIGRFRRGLNCL